MFPAFPPLLSKAKEEEKEEKEEASAKKIGKSDSGSTGKTVWFTLKAKAEKATSWHLIDAIFYSFFVCFAVSAAAASICKQAKFGCKWRVERNAVYLGRRRRIRRSR
jgi:hypothetical protein